MAGEPLGQRYADALFSGDFETLGRLRHDDYVSRWPQSGEIVRGHDAWVEITERYPLTPESDGHVSGETKLNVTNVKTPLPFGPPILAMSGGSKTFTIEGLIRYPDGKLWHSVLICQVAEGKVVSETGYFAEPFDPPDWRADLVELEN